VSLPRVVPAAACSPAAALKAQSLSQAVNGERQTPSAFTLRCDLCLRALQSHVTAPPARDLRLQTTSALATGSGAPQLRPCNQCIVWTAPLHSRGLDGLRGADGRPAGTFEVLLASSGRRAGATLAPTMPCHTAAPAVVSICLRHSHDVPDASSIRLYVPCAHPWHPCSCPSRLLRNGHGKRTMRRAVAAFIAGRFLWPMGFHGKTACVCRCQQAGSRLQAALSVPRRSGLPIPGHLV
jgi:hypothetical protein